MKALEADAGMLDHFGISLVSAREGTCVLQATVLPRLLNAAGFAHGGVAYVMADTACAYALSSHERRGVTVHANMSYHKPATTNAMLTATARVVSLTKRTASMQAEVRSGDKLLAHGSFSFSMVDS
jgi:acyl-CoA thioesterase